MDGNEKISSIDVTATVRPTKLAFLIPDNMTIQWVLDELIPWFSSVWGGGNYFFVPVSDQLANDQKIVIWIKLLQKFDPDRVISLGDFPRDFISFIKEQLLIRSDIFQYSKGAVPVGQMIKRGHEYTMPLEHLFESTGPSVAINEYSLTGSTLHDLWFFSHVGRLGKYLSDVTALGKGPTVTKHHITSTQISKFCERISEYKYPTNVSDCALLKSMSYLGYAGAKTYFDDYKLPNIIVVGQTLRDWCLFQSLWNFYPGVRWIPEGLLSTSTTGQPNDFDVLLYSLTTNTAKQTVPVFTSESIDKNALDSIIQATLKKINTTFSKAQSVTYEIEDDFNLAIPNWIQWGEANNYNEMTMIFQGRRSVQKAPLLSPKQFKVDRAKAKFMVDLHSTSYKYLGHCYIKDVPVEWPNPAGVTKDVARRSFIGEISFNPIANIGFSGQDLESALRGPRVVKRTLIEDLESLLARANLAPVKSIGSMNVSAALGLWNGSVDSFSENYYESDTKIIFAAFKAGSKAKKLPSIAIKPTGGITLKNKFLFSYPIDQAFLNPPQLFSQAVFEKWLESEIILRGEKLTCLRCGQVDFYPETQVAKFFSCKRCENQNTRNLITMGAPEPRFLYDLNPLIYGLQEGNSDLVLFGAKKIKELSEQYFEFEPEVEIHSSDRSTQEIDLICNVDGALVVGECKSNGQLNGSQLRNYVVFCDMFKVQKFFCVSATKWSASAKQNIKNSFAKLKDLEVLFFET